MTPAISVVMSIYEEPVVWIKQSVQSILNQTFTDFEFIIVNDSPEREENRSLLDSFLALDKRVIVITNEKNIGLTKSLNLALTKSRGQYVARMDADDISLRNRLELQYDFLNKNPQVLLCGSCAHKINEDGKKIGQFEYPFASDDLKLSMFLENPFSHPTLLFKNPLYLAEPFCYDSSLKYAQDYALVYEFAKRGGVSNLTEKLIEYRVSQMQISKSKFKDQQLCFLHTRDRYIADELGKRNINFNNGEVSLCIIENELKTSSDNVTLVYMKLSLLLYGESLSLDQLLWVMSKKVISVKMKLKFFLKFLKC